MQEKDRLLYFSEKASVQFPEDLQEFIEQLDLVRRVNNIKAFLTEDVSAAASEKLEKLTDCHEPEIEIRFSILRKTFALTKKIMSR
ncbi:MAG: hypothetical protein IT392_02125 [Nitrospirae bacterium]|nr:hypothetical protein [Nitrospirota bacterium]